jgi:hypothetical protein
VSTTHTPGTWVLDSDPDGRLYVAQEYQGKPGGRICEVFQNCLVDRKTKRANGSLLGAAPELLDACRSAILFVAYMEKQGYPVGDTYTAINDAIAKATGVKS